MSNLLRKLSWDDLRIIMAIGKSGTLARAAEMLGVNNSTIARRLAKVEDVLGATLFDRRRIGYIATVEGEQLIAVAERVELDLVSVVRRVSGSATGYVGDLRITTSDSILLYFLTPLIASFKERNPAIKMEVIVGNASLNLARGESDIAVRATESPPENLFGRKIATIAWAPYGALSDPGLRDGGALFDREWVSYTGQLSGLKAYGFVGEHVSHDNITYRTDSVAGAAAAIAAGLGVGYLPCMLGDLSPDLARLGATEPELNDELWLLTHPDIRKSDRICGFMAHCIEAMSRDRGLIEGQSVDEGQAQLPFGKETPSSLLLKAAPRLEAVGRRGPSADRPSEDLLDAGDQPRAVDRLFEQIRILAGPRQVGGALGIRGDDDYGHRQLPLSQDPPELEPINAWHVKVGNDEVEAVGTARKEASRGRERLDTDAE